MITEFPIPTIGSSARGIITGPDGNLWFTEQLGNNIGRITTAGVITEFPLPNFASHPLRITVGPDGNLWFTEQVGRIGRANAGFFLSGTVTDDGLPAGATLTTTWSAASGPGSVSFGTPAAPFPNVAGRVNPVVTSATFNTPGTYTLSLTGSDSQLSSSSNVTVTVNPSPTATLISVNPNTGQQGQQNLSVAIAGQFTHFVQGTTTATFGAGITLALPLTVNSATSAIAVLNIDPAAAIGARNVTLTTSTEVVTLSGGFTVNGTPVLTLVNPNTGQQGQQNLSVAITGQFTHFAQGTTMANFGTGTTVTAVSVTNPTSLTAQISIGTSATLGARAVTVITGAEVVTLVDGFSVSSAPNQAPIISISPNPPVSQALELLVAGFITGNVLRFNGTSGAFIDTFIPTGSGGLSRASIMLGPDGNLYVANNPADGGPALLSKILAD